MITDSVDSLGVRTNGVIGALRIASPHHFGAIIVSQRVFRILPLGPNGWLVRACPFSMLCTSERIFKGISSCHSPALQRFEDGRSVLLDIGIVIYAMGDQCRNSLWAQSYPTWCPAHRPAEERLPPLER